ncbi:MAG: glycerophosphodiester phosphodiesterase [Gemmatimonadaceae bacterium]
MYSIRNPPKAISHRGLRHDVPENSIAAFNAAILAGAEGIELDVHASSDGVVFVHHDPVVVTAGGVSLPIATAPAAEMDDTMLADGKPVPRLDDVLEAIGTAAEVFVEVKGIGIETYVAACLGRHFSKCGAYAVHAFDHRTVKRMLELGASLRTGILQVAYPISSTTAMRAAGASDLWQQQELVDDGLVQDVHSVGGRVIVWTSNDEASWERLTSLGVDGICTDRVDDYVAWRAARQSRASTVA